MKQERINSYPTFARTLFIGATIGCIMQGTSEIAFAQLPAPNARTMWQFMEEYNGPDKITRLLNSFACGQIPDQTGNGLVCCCSGTMISPHIFMSAGHCGSINGPPRSVNFFRIDEDAAAEPANQSLSDSYTARSFPWHNYVPPPDAWPYTNQTGDTALWWLEDGPDGVPPGIKYGYLELSSAGPVVGDVAYSFWVNPATNLANSDTLFYSTGVVNTINCRGGFPWPDASCYNIFAVGGASGSSIIGTGRHGHRIMSVTSRGDANGRDGFDTSYLLKEYDASANDSSTNGVMDAIEYDWLITSKPRNFYRLGFDSSTKRAPWRRSFAIWDSITNDFGLWVGQVKAPAGAGTYLEMFHSTARFVPNGRYRISIVAYGFATDASPAYVRFVSDSSGSQKLVTFQPVVGEWRRFTGNVWLDNHSDYRLTLGDGGAGRYYVLDVALIKENGDGSLNFETDEERRSWEYIGGAYPTSWGMDGSTDFSGIVVGPSPDLGGQSWSLRNRYVGLEANQSYTISFDVKHVSGTLSAGNFMKIQDLGGVIKEELRWGFPSVGARLSFTNEVSIDSTMGHTLTFGSSDSVKYMVDNIRIYRAGIHAPGTIFHGPAATPHVRSSDSPFDMSRLGTDFFLENFESGTLGVDGVSLSSGVMVTSGACTDSVDEDDGFVDGVGGTGHSLFSNDGRTGIMFTFDPVRYGSFPTRAGVVWTDGAGETVFEAFDAHGASLGMIGPVSIADANYCSTIGDDRFFGVTYLGGISAIKIYDRNADGGIEVDHLQYGGFSACRPLVESFKPGTGGTTPQMAYDDSLGTYLHTGSLDLQWLQIDLGCESELTGLRRYMSRNGSNISGSRVDEPEWIGYSLDALNWQYFLPANSHGWESFPSEVSIYPTWHSVSYGWSPWITLNETVRARYVRFGWAELDPSDYLHEVQLNSYPVPSPSPNLAAAGYSPLKGFHFSLLGRPGESYIIEASTNLLDWVPINTNIPLNGVFEFTDPGVWNFRERFFRGVLVR